MEADPRTVLNSIDLFDIPWKPFELLEKDQRAMRWDLESLAARLARHVVVDPDKMILHLAEERAIALVRAGGNLRLLGPPHPADRIIIRATAARALKSGGPLLGFFGKEVAFVHEAIVSASGPKP
jgi:hypothetical protein